MVETKICTKCKKELPATTEYFSSNKQHKDSLKSWCRGCCNKANREYRQTERGRIVQRQATKNYYQQHPEYRRKVNLKKYNITLADYDKMFEEQNGLCAICRLPEINMRLCVDHNHKTKEIRKLLCRNCNRRLEVLEDKEFVEKAQEYLTKFNHIQTIKGK